MLGRVESGSRRSPPRQAGRGREECHRVAGFAGPAEARLQACRALEILEPTYRVASQADSATAAGARIQHMTRMAQDENLGAIARSQGNVPGAGNAREVLGVSPEDFCGTLDQAKTAASPGLEDHYPPWISLKAHGFARQLVEHGVDPQKATGHVLQFLSLGLEVNTYGLVVPLVECGADPERALSHVMMCSSLGRDPLEVPLAREASAADAPAPHVEQTETGVNIGGLFVPRAHRDPSPPAA